MLAENIHGYGWMVLYTAGTIGRYVGLAKILSIEKDNAI